MIKKLNFKKLLKTLIFKIIKLKLIIYVQKIISKLKKIKNSGDFLALFLSIFFVIIKKIYFVLLFLLFLSYHSSISLSNNL